MKALAQNTLIQNRYLIVHLIGKGGMGEVYLAVDQRLGSAVALKRTFFAGDETLGNAFEREARILGRMRHPVLPKVSDHFGEGEEQFLVMEHISGDDLAKRLEAAQKPFPISWVLFWADQLLDALTYLHSNEPPIIHRDIKPQNLKLTDENHIILLDFGLSKSSTGQTNLNATPGSTGSVVGYTPHYAPMEQIRGIGTNPRSDVYSLSATLYQLMTNTVPADALSRADSLLNAMPDPIVPPHKLNPEVPESVSDAILHGMEVSQDRRFATTREMQKVLRKAFTQMQEGMSAQTVAFSVQEQQDAGIDHPILSSPQRNEIMEVGQIITQPRGAISFDDAVPDNAAKTPSHETTVEPDQDFEATLAFDSDVNLNSAQQAGIKTEVFLTSDSQPFPERSTSFEEEGKEVHHSFPDASAVSRSDNGNETGFSPEAAVPIIAYDSGTANGQTPIPENAPDFYPSPDFAAAQPDQYATVAVGGFAQNEASAAPVFDTPAPRAVVAKKKSSGKVFAILGGLAALFVLGAAAISGGWYYYTNYYAAGVVAEPSPSPEPSFEPSPEPAFESIFDANTDNSNSGVADNSNTQINTVEPTPVPTEDQTTGIDSPVSKPRPQGTVRNTPARTSTPNARQTPKPKPSGRRTDILQ